MHLSKRPLALTVGTTLLFALAASAQEPQEINPQEQDPQTQASPPQASREKEPGAAKRLRLYDPSTEATMKGTVEEVMQPTRGQRMRMGTHLVLKTGADTTQVILGPTAYIASKGFTFAKGDTVEVTGSKLTRNQTNYIIARQVVKGGKTLTLRDKEGTPLWARRGADCPPCGPSE
jgi:hypothetical protein